MKGARGLSKITLRPDENLTKIIGDKEISITEFPKLTWKYFYANKLVFKDGKPLEKKV
jgi:hypothetical protein